MVAVSAIIGRSGYFVPSALRRQPVDREVCIVESKGLRPWLKYPNSAYRFVLALNSAFEFDLEESDYCFQDNERDERDERDDNWVHHKISRKSNQII